MGQETETKDKLIFYEQLWEMLQGLQIGVFTVDAERKISSFNRAAEMITGYKEEDIIGRPCHEVFKNTFCLGDCKYHEALEAGQKSLSFDLEITDASGERRMVSKIVTPIYDMNRDLAGCIEVFQDRSAFKELIERIRYDEQRFKMILDNLDVAVFTVTRGGLITFFNNEAEGLTGYDRKEILGKPCSTIFGGEDTKDVTLLKHSVADGKPRSGSRGLLISKDGRRIPIRGNYMALRNEQDRIVGGLATIQDLSLIYQLNRAISSRYTFADMVGKDPSMQKIFEIVPVVASSEATILIEGPTGTGKDLLAKVIHNASNRAKKPMVKVNCAALPDNLLESEMFGYVKGAFTGADRDKPGRFQEADGGTIFLDEIGDLPLSLQAKLLRVLEDKEFYPLGSRRTTKVDVRIVAATNRGLERLVSERRFREDLFYRLNVIRLDLPALKHRKSDLPLLIEHILKRLRVTKRSPVQRISHDAMEVLLNHDYPGNVRELENILEHALIICQDDVIERRHLPLSLHNGVPRPYASEQPFEGADTFEKVDEKHRIIDVLKRHNWHRGRAAKELNIDRTTLWRKMKRYGISR